MLRMQKKSGENKRTRILRAVPTNEWVNSAQVAEASGVSKELVHPQLSALYRAGFLERRETGGGVIEHRVLFKRICETIYLVGRTGVLRRHHQLRESSDVTGLITVGHTTHRPAKLDRVTQKQLDDYIAYADTLWKGMNSRIVHAEKPELPSRPSLLTRIINAFKRIFSGVST